MKAIVKITMENTNSHRNPVAAALRQGQFQKRIVRDRTKYNRKGKSNKGWE